MAAIENPIFLVGSERSGTTLLRLLLDHHPRIAFNLESAFITSQIGEDGAPPDMEGYRDFLRHSRVFAHSRFTIDETLGFADLVNDFLLQKLSRDGKERVGATIHTRFHHLPRLWPKAKYIYLFRDGRDVANSVMRMGWAGNVYVAADWWLKAEREWKILCAGIGPDQRIEVRYEDLVENTRAELERICAFIDVDFSEKMFDYVGSSTYEAPDPRLSYQWKKRMAPIDVQRLEDKLHDELLHRGYELSDLPRLQVSPLQRKLLFIQSKLGTLRFRFERYGASLVLAELLSRRLKLKGIHDRALARISRIDDAHLK